MFYGHLEIRCLLAYPGKRRQRTIKCDTKALHHVLIRNSIRRLTKESEVPTLNDPAAVVKCQQRRLHITYSGLDN